MGGSELIQHQAVASERPRPTSRRRFNLAQAAWLGALALGAYLRFAYIELSEFGVDQETALHYARTVRRGWEFPLVGMASSVGPVFGPGEYYLMALPQFISDSPELSIVYVGLLGLFAGALFSYLVWRHLGRFEGVVTMALFATGPWAVYLTRKIWTPDTLPLFSALAFACLIAGLVRKRWWGVPLAAFCIGYAVQVHHSAVGLLPGFLLVVLLFIRRQRLWQTALSLLTLALPSSLYAWHAWQDGPTELIRLLNLYGKPPDYDLRSVDLALSLLSGAHYVDGLDVSFPPGVVVPQLPGVVLLLGLASCLGLVVVAYDLWRTRSRGQLTAANVVRVIALVWVLVPLALTVRHSFELYLRYELFLLPIAFLFPAAGLTALARIAAWLGRRFSSQSVSPQSRWALALSAAVILYVALSGAVRVEAVYRSYALATFPVLGGPYESTSLPLLGETRQAFDHLQTIAAPDRDAVVVGQQFITQRGPVEYLNDNRYRLRLSDTDESFLLPNGKSRLLFLSGSQSVGKLVEMFGGKQRTDLEFGWPPRDERVNVYDLEARSLPTGFTTVKPGQILANGLELLAYGANTTDERNADLVSVWRISDADLALRPYYFYNAFVHVFEYGGQQVDVGGEAELPMTAQWRTGDYVVVPFHLATRDPLVRALYRIEAGVYVRNPPRAPLPTLAGSLPVASLGLVRLGPSIQPLANAGQTAEFGNSLRLAASSVSRAGNLVEASLVWQAKAAVSQDYTVFVHVYDQAGQLAAQSDGWPANGNYPTSGWQPGEYVADKRTVNLPPNLPPGTYTVKVGLYDAKTMERLAPAPDHGDRAVVIGTFQSAR